MQGSGSRIQGTGLRVQSSGCKVEGAGLRVEISTASEIITKNMANLVWGVGFRV